MLGLQSYWDSAYANELANFRKHGHAGEVWFGTDVIEIVASWTKSLCIDICKGQLKNHVDGRKSEPVEDANKYLSSWNVLDIGTGNGLLLQELSKQGEGAINLAQSLSQRDGFPNISFLVDDILETKLERQFQLVVDKRTVDAVGLHPNGPKKRIMYWDSICRLVTRGGILVITSCNSTKDELMQEAGGFNKGSIGAPQEIEITNGQVPSQFQYISYFRSYPTFEFGGPEGSCVATVAFQRN